MIKSVHFAHPTSPAAIELGHPENGCFYVRFDDEEKGATLSQPFATIGEAEDYAEKEPGIWSRWYVASPPEGSRFYRHNVRWADTHDGRVAQWKAIVARHEAKRPTMATLRKGWFGSTAPRYVAEFEDGTVHRASFWQAKSGPYDFARGRKVAIGSSGKTIVRGFVEHDIPGGEFVRIEDPMTESKAKVRKPSCRKVLERIIAAINNDNLAELKDAYNDALQAVA